MPSNKKRSVSANTAPASQTAANKASNTSRSTFSQEFNPDYSYVIRDLKHIGVMAASFLVILVVLSFFLR